MLSKKDFILGIFLKYFEFLDGLRSLSFTVVGEQRNDEHRMNNIKIFDCLFVLGETRASKVLKIGLMSFN